MCATAQAWKCEYFSSYHRLQLFFLSIVLNTYPSVRVYCSPWAVCMRLLSPGSNVLSCMLPLWPVVCLRLVTFHGLPVSSGSAVPKFLLFQQAVVYVPLPARHFTTFSHCTLFVCIFLQTASPSFAWLRALIEFLGGSLDVVHRTCGSKHGHMVCGNVLCNTVSSQPCSALFFQTIYCFPLLAHTTADCFSKCFFHETFYSSERCVECQVITLFSRC